VAGQTNYNFSQIVQIFRDYSESHKQLNGFEVGWPYDMANSGNRLYPSMFVNPSPSVIMQNQLALKFNIFFVSIITQDQSDMIKTLSDMLSVSLDFVAYMENTYLHLMEFEGQMNLTPYVWVTGDNLAGWMLQFTVRLDSYNDPCIVPIA
jgi:hypothetical protein